MQGEDRRVRRLRQPAKIVDFFRQSPLVGLDLDFERDRSPAREIDLGAGSRAPKKTKKL